MRTKNIQSALLLSILIFAVFASINFVSATTSINAPAASTTVGCRAFTVFNVTTNDTLNGNNALVNLTFYAQSTSTANSSWVSIGTNNSLNLTTLANQTMTNINLTGLLEDATNYQFNVTVGNTTSATIFNTSVISSMVVDCGVPPVPTSLNPKNYDYNRSGTQNFSATVTDGNTTACTFTIARGGVSSGSDRYSSVSGNYSGSTCTAQMAFSTSADNGDWYWYMTASDGTNTTSAGANILNIQITPNPGGLTPELLAQVKKEKAAQALAAAQADGTSGLQGLFSNPVLWIVIIVIVVIIFIVKSQKRR